MTRATPKPLVRVVEGGRYGTLAVAITSDMLTIRPKRARWNGPVSFVLTWPQLYQWAAQARADQLRRERKETRRKKK